MENAVGIEAARARLGDIAETARMTGQITRLTRHGRTVAVIGPASTVKPAVGVTVLLLFPHTMWECLLPTVPRVGETLTREVQYGEEVWKVTGVDHYLHLDAEPTVGVTLEPADDYTRKLLAAEQAKRPAQAKRATEK
ncbi:hypothetical protein [Streptomyces violaceus]|uniref:Antitoxin n=1 Tax=Streptomyces violaceus TaxID=1936 RepID=A0ABY9UPK4_STRVL|nr:hypothetical protein [Streptomyces janthinus]WND24131.1 hypothetical protein RI060_43200 [Streptomyces janthinus]GGS96976.1 hypothetical protein GCM10010270_81240 [Streptomyces janthinus]